MTTFRPTRTCPHRLCRPLHLINGVGGLLFIAALAPVRPWILAVFGVGLLFAVGIYQLVHKQTMVDTVREQVEQTVVITTRTGWARAAVTVDAFWTAVILLMLAATLADTSSSDANAAPTGWTLLLSVALSVFLIVGNEVVHRNAARVSVAAQAVERAE